VKAGGVRAGGEKNFSSVKQLCVEKLLDNTIGWPLAQGLRNDDKAVPDTAGPGRCVMQPLHKDAIRAASRVTVDAIRHRSRQGNGKSPEPANGNVRAT
jgi:hypothetical protein